jgi:TRAP-type C4-dicarboxylate transport system permease small subunit
MDLYIDSGSHGGTDIKRRIKEAEDAIDDPDAVFTEDPVRVSNRSQLIYSFVLAPLLVGLMATWLYIILPLYQRITNSDRQIERYFIDEYSVDKIPADAPRLSLILKDKDLSMLSNWIPTLLILLYILVNAPRTGNQLFLLVILFGIGCSLFLSFLSGMHSTRNIHIAQEILQKSSQYTQAILITGGEHHEDVASLLQSDNSVNVVNPERQNQ